jgi:hypothetical protein
VRGVQALQGVDHHRHDEIERTLVAAALPQGRERRTLHVLHHDVVVVALTADVDDGDDVRVVDPRRDARFVAEHVDEAAFFRQVRVQHLHGEEPLEPRFSCVTREVHRPHAAARKLSDDLVSPEEAGSASPSSRRHRRRVHQ